jgi:hypothetical protein
VPQNPRKRIRTNLPFSNMFVPVHVPAQRNFRIIQVKYRDIFQPDGAFDLPDRRSQPALRLDVVARRKQVRRIQACFHR